MQIIEAGGEDGRPSYDVRPGDQLFGVLVKHGLLDAVLDGFDLCFGLFEQFFKGLDFFDFGNDFSGRHGVLSFHSLFLILKEREGFAVGLSP